MEKEFDYIKLATSDINGILRGKYIKAKDFASLTEDGLGFCDIVFNADVQDRTLDNFLNSNQAGSYPDTPLKIMPDTLRPIPFENKVGIALCEAKGQSEHKCPRSLLRRLVERADAMGYLVYVGLDYEFTLFDETIESLQHKGYKQLKPITPNSFNSSILRTGQFSEFYENLFSTCEEMRVPLESMHTEWGPGMLEAAIGYDHALQAADKAVLFKMATKVLAHRMGKTASFMAKWSPEVSGQSGHVHISLRDKSDLPIFYDPNDPNRMSNPFKHFVAGIEKHLPEMMSLYAPTMNSYARFAPGLCAPETPRWAIDQRQAAIRVLQDKPSKMRVECRVPGADSNPYLAIAATLASGLWGIEQGYALTPPLGAETEAETPALPMHLGEAARQLRQSDVAREWLGQDFVSYFAGSRDWEVQQAQRAVTDWDIERYLEAI